MRWRWVAALTVALTVVGGCSLLDPLDDISGAGPERTERTPDASDASFVSDASSARDVLDVSDASSALSCNQAKPFGAAIALAPSINGASHELHPTLTNDERVLMFERSGGPIFAATRSSLTGGFVAPVPVTLQPFTAFAAPTITGDGLVLFFEGLKTGETRRKIFQTSRARLDLAFPEPTPLKALNDPIGEETVPTVAADGAEVWASSDREGIVGVRHLLRSVRGADAGYESATLVTELTSASSEVGVALSSDGLTIYFGSDRPAGLGQSDIWVARRPRMDASFGAATNVTELNSKAGDVPGWLSPDGCRFYFASDRNGDYDVFMASRPP